MAQNFGHDEYVILVQSTKLDTHENKVIHNNLRKDKPTENR